MESLGDVLIFKHSTWSLVKYIEDVKENLASTLDFACNENKHYKGPEELFL